MKKATEHPSDSEIHDSVILDFEQLSKSPFSGELHIRVRYQNINALILFAQV